jgi:hypothetical protein
MAEGWNTLYKKHFSESRIFNADGKACFSEVCDVNLLMWAQAYKLDIVQSDLNIRSTSSEIRYFGPSLSETVQSFPPFVIKTVLKSSAAESMSTSIDSKTPYGEYLRMTALWNHLRRCSSCDSAVGCVRAVDWIPALLPWPSGQYPGIEQTNRGSCADSSLSKHQVSTNDPGAPPPPHLVMENGGYALGSLTHPLRMYALEFSFRDYQHCIWQLLFTLASARTICNFSHQDLHVMNILIYPFAALCGGSIGTFPAHDPSSHLAAPTSNTDGTWNLQYLLLDKRITGHRSSRSRAVASSPSSSSSSSHAFTGRSYQLSNVNYTIKLCDLGLSTLDSPLDPGDSDLLWLQRSAATLFASINVNYDSIYDDALRWNRSLSQMLGTRCTSTLSLYEILQHENFNLVATAVS